MEMMSKKISQGVGYAVETVKEWLGFESQFIARQRHRRLFKIDAIGICVLFGESVVKKLGIKEF